MTISAIGSVSPFAPDESNGAAKGPEQQSGRKALITLVHGTWGRFRLPFTRPLWFEDGSTFVAELSSSLRAHGLEPNVSPFLWSGANSLFDRADAGFRLSRSLAKEHTANPEALQVVIGHSHGGSVCLLGLQSLPSGASPLLVTLATPFVEIVRSEPKGQEANVKHAIQKGIVSPLLFLMVLLLYRQLGITQYDYLVWAFGFAVNAANALPTLYGLGKPSALSDAGEQNAWARPEARRPELYRSLTVGGATIGPPRRMLALRAVDDEAGLALAAGAIGNRLSAIALALLIKLTHLLIYVCGAALAVVFLEDYWPSALAYPTNLIAAAVSNPFFAYATLGPTTAFFCIPVIAGVFKSVYGRELLIGGYFCDLKSASAPDAEANLSTVTLPPGDRRGMRHGIYNNESAVPEIVNFIVSQSIQQPPTKSAA